MHGSAVYDADCHHRESANYNAQLAVLFDKHDFNAFPVVEDGKLCGIISKFDVFHAFAFTTSQVVPHYNELMNRTTAEVMTEAVVHVDPASPLTRVSPIDGGLKTRSFPVMSAKRGGRRSCGPFPRGRA